MLNGFIDKISSSYLKNALASGVFMTLSLFIIFNHLLVGAINIYAGNEIILLIGFLVASLIIGELNSLFSAIVVYDLFCVIYDRCFKKNLMERFGGFMGMGSGYFVMCSHLILPTALWGWAFPYFINRPEYLSASVLCSLLMSIIFFALGLYTFLRFMATKTKKTIKSQEDE